MIYIRCIYIYLKYISLFCSLWNKLEILKPFRSWCPFHPLIRWNQGISRWVLWAKLPRRGVGNPALPHLKRIGERNLNITQLKKKFIWTEATFLGSILIFQGVYQKETMNKKTPNTNLHISIGQSCKIQKGRKQIHDFVLSINVFSPIGLSYTNTSLTT